MLNPSLAGRLASLCVLLVGLAVGAGCDQAEPETCADGVLRAEDLVVGTGQAVNRNSNVAIRYIGYVGTAEGVVFDSTRTARPGTSSFALSSPGLVPGFRLGIGGTEGTNLPEIPSMRIGGTRRITIPPNLGYAAQTVTSPEGIVLIPSCTTIVFDVELIDS